MDIIKLAIADDEALFRKGIKVLLEDNEDLRVIMEAENGQDLLDKLSSCNDFPEVLLLDLQMPILDGIETAKILQERYPDLKIIVLSSHFSKAFVLNMIELGAASYLPKNSDPDEVANTIRSVAQKGFYYNQKVLEVIRENIMNKTLQKPKASLKIELTRREEEILQLICEQFTTSEIAQKLYISPRTVDGHRNNLLGKLGCRNTAGLVVYALENKIVKVKPNAWW